MFRWNDDGNSSATPPSTRPGLPLRPHRYVHPENLPRAHYPGGAPPPEDGYGAEG